jgi:hypothetical protein
MGACATTQTTKGGLEPYAVAGISDRQAAGKRFALVIGTDEYTDTTYPDLRYATADAQAVAQALEEWDEVEVLMTPEATTLEGVERAVAALASKARHPRDTALIYISGHGTLGRRAGGPLERFIVPTDAARDIVGSGVAVSELVSQLEAMGAQKKGLVLATCYNGREKSALSEALAAELASHKGEMSPLLERSQALIIASAASFGEAAIEDGSLGHDVYTWYLLEALERGDRDLDGAVTLTEAHDYARDRTYRFTEGRQRPSARAVVLGQDPIVLAGETSSGASPLLYSYDDNADGLTVVLDGQTKGELPGGIPVDAGVHRVQLVGDGRVVHSEKIRLEPGERLSLAELVRSSVGWSVRTGVAGGLGLGAEGTVLRPGALGPMVSVERRAADSPWVVEAGVGFERWKNEQLGWSHAAVDLSLGALVVDSPTLRLNPLAGMSMTWSRWEQGFDFETQALGAVPALGARLVLVPSRHLELGAAASAGVHLVPRQSGDAAATPAASATLFSGWSL